MRIALIAAFADNHVLGKDNALPWSLPADWKHFRAVTGSTSFITGRKSYEAEDRLLSPGRNLILTRREHLPEHNCEPVPSLQEALSRVEGEELVFITGGASVFREAMPLANEAWLTLVHATPQGDAWFPPVDWELWNVQSRKAFPQDQAHDHAFDIVHMTRSRPWSLALPES